VPDGTHAINYLNGFPPHSDRGQFPFPDLAILDIQMPNGNGFDVLKFLHHRPDLPSYPRNVFRFRYHWPTATLVPNLGRLISSPNLSLSKGFAEFAEAVDHFWFGRKQWLDVFRLRSLQPIPSIERGISAGWHCVGCHNIQFFLSAAEHH